MIPQNFSFNDGDTGNVNITQFFILLVFALAFLVTGFAFVVKPPFTAPYPPSSEIKSISWDFANRVRLAPGSDLWPTTWGADDNIYTSWGDGGGFGGTNEDGRVSLGFARIEGSPTAFNGVNVWGGKDAENPATFTGKASGMLSVGGTLYAWINLQDDTWPNVSYTLAFSSDLGATWRKASWVFPKGDGNFKPQTFLNFGQDYADARDRFVYFYGTKQDDVTNGYMGRVPQNQIKEKDSYEYFTGLDANGDPTWSADITQIKPVFTDLNATDEGIISVIYNPAIKRYIMTTHHGGIQKLGVFDAPEPWGPWTTVVYYENWGGYNADGLLYEFPTKWISIDGKTMWMIYSGGSGSSKSEVDAFLLAKATLTPADSTSLGAPILFAPSNAIATRNSNLTFDWSEVTGSEIMYQLWVDNNFDFSSPEIIVNGLTASSFTPATALVDGTHAWQVQAVDEAGNVGPWSDVWTVTIK